MGRIKLFFLGICLAIFTCFSGHAQSLQRDDVDSIQIQNIYNRLTAQYQYNTVELWILIVPSIQKLMVLNGVEVFKTYSVSTGKAGLGSENGSLKTPTGTHRIKEKHGQGAEIGAIFKSRVNTGKVSNIFLDKNSDSVDYIITRILWLEGLEFGKNKGDNIDSYERYIYIHGTPQEGLIGLPVSMGCIRMKSLDIIELFDLVETGTLVEILDVDYPR